MPHSALRTQSVVPSFANHSLKSKRSSHWRPKLLTLAVAQALSMPTLAAEIFVNDAGDGDSPTTCTLRQAVVSSNTNAVGSSNCVAGSGPDVIRFADDVVSTATISLTQSSALIISENVYIDGPHDAPLVIDGMGNAGVFELDVAQLTLKNLSITGGFAPSEGGGEGGGVKVGQNSLLTLTNSSVTGNSAAYFGGGLAARASASITLNNSTVSGNTAGVGTTIGLGGGIFAITDSSIGINNSTVSGNSAVSRGGGVYLSASTAGIRNSTVSGNSAAMAAGGVYVYQSQVDLTNNIVAGNLALAGSEVLVSSYDGSVSLISGTNNVLGQNSQTNAQAFSNFTIGGSDITATSDGTQPTALANILEPLAANGGKTLTHALPTNSPALSAAEGSACINSPIDSLDQRGLARNSFCDIGAFEAQTSAIITVGSALDGTGSCTLRDAIISSNSDTSIGGCVAGNNSDTIVFDPSVFAPLESNTITLASSLPTVTSQTAIIGPGQSQLTIDANQTGRFLYMRYAMVTLSDLTITGGVTSLFGRGGGILAFNSLLSVNNATIRGNVAPQGLGGGIYAALESSVRLSNVTLSDNSAGAAGGIAGRVRTKLDIVNSTVSGNDASTGSLRGGGVYLSGQSRLNLSNSTVSGNSSGNDAGGISILSSNATIVNSTISNNVADNYGGALTLRGQGSTTIINSILAGNSANNMYAEIFTNGASALTSRYNVLGDASNSRSSAFAAAFVPQASEIIATSDGTLPTELSDILAPLADNGGTTHTHELVVNSPALNAADQVSCGVAPINNLDQRGERRGVCDIGSFEAEESQFFVVPLTGGKSVIFSL